MKQTWTLLLLALVLTGCKTVAEIKPDTIVDIPLRPTQAQTEPPTEMTAAPTETEPTGAEPPTEAPAQIPTEKTGSTSGGNTSGGKTPGKTGSASKPPATQPPTEPVTQPPTEAPTEPPTQPPTEAPTEPPAYDPAGYMPGALDRAVADAVNGLRQEARLAELIFDARLCAIASVRARELSLDWSHSRPDGSDGLTVLDQYGYVHSWAAENLYNGAGSGEKIAARWMTADPTAGNILSQSASAIGVGSYTTEDGLTCVAAIFAG